MDSRGDLVAADDVLLFVNAAITATGQREFHAEAAEQQLSLDFLHSYVVNYRELYAATLALDINDHNAVQVVRRLLESAGEATEAEARRGPTDRAPAGAAAAAAGLRTLPGAAPGQGQQPPDPRHHAGLAGRPPGPRPSTP